MRLVAKAVLWLHSMLYRLSNGRIGGRFIAGSPILLLTTIGRRTGKQRTRPLAYVRDSDRFRCSLATFTFASRPPSTSSCMLFATPR